MAARARLMAGFGNRMMKKEPDYYKDRWESMGIRAFVPTILDPFAAHEGKYAMPGIEGTIAFIAICMHLGAWITIAVLDTELWHEKFKNDATAMQMAYSFSLLSLITLWVPLVLILLICIIHVFDEGLMQAKLMLGRGMTPPVIVATITSSASLSAVGTFLLLLYEMTTVTSGSASMVTKGEFQKLLVVLCFKIFLSRLVIANARYRANDTETSVSETTPDDEARLISSA